MKLAIINSAYSGGGAERVARELFHWLIARGDDAEMYVGRIGSTPSSRVNPMKLPGERFLRLFERPGTIRDWRHLGSRLKLRRFPSRYDIVHFHNLHGGYLSLKAVNRLCQRMPVVWSLHDEWAVGDGVPGDLARVMDATRVEAIWGTGRGLLSNDSYWDKYRPFVKRWMPTPAALVCHSEHIERLVRASARWRDVPCYMVRIPVPMQSEAGAQANRSEAKVRFGFAPSEKVVLMVANSFSIVYKGITFGVDALRNLPADLFRCLLVGHDAQKIASQIPQKSICTGNIGDSLTLALAYRAADVTLVPSVVESFGLVAAESLACETPVAAFRIGGLVEILGANERGLLAPAVDCEALAANVTTLLDDPTLRERLGRAGREWVIENCNPERSFEQVLNVYSMARDAFERAHPRLPARPSIFPG